jgi:hypothetical protein
VACGPVSRDRKGLFFCCAGRKDVFCRANNDGWAGSQSPGLLTRRKPTRCRRDCETVTRLQAHLTTSDTLSQRQGTLVWICSYRSLASGKH